MGTTINNNFDNALHTDREHIWHPYNSATPSISPILIEEAKGVKLKTAEGKWLIDGMSSWWATIHGYNHPSLNKALREQSEKMSHVMFGGLTHEPAIRLTKQLLDIVPEGLHHVFYSDSGSVAVEVSMKMALQYWQSQYNTQKNQFVTIKQGYHGDTWHAMSVCDPVTGMHHIFQNKLAIQHFLPAPKSTFHGTYNPKEIEEVENYLKQHHEQLAAFILEPVVQGAGGMRFYHPLYLKNVAELCKKYNLLLIADEIATGFGRTGKTFACEYAEVTPDILCIGKALTGGYLSFAATLCTNHIGTTISESELGLFMHGPTFMGNPLACAVASASIDLSQKNKYDIGRIEARLNESLSPLNALEEVEDVRVLGAIGVVEMKNPVDMQQVKQLCLDHGVWLRPFGKLVYTMPPLVISEEELQQLTEGIVEIVKALKG